MTLDDAIRRQACCWVFWPGFLPARGLTIVIDEIRPTEWRDVPFASGNEISVLIYTVV